MGVTEAGASSASQDQQASGRASTSGPQMPFPKDCRACLGAQQMITSFKRLVDTKKGSTSSQGSDSSKRTSSAAIGAGVAAAATAAVAAGTASRSGTQQQRGPSDSPAATPVPPTNQAPLPCPPESGDLGHASWTFLHTMAAYYPDEPSYTQKSLMRSMMEGLAEFYPCSICAEHLKHQIADSPPDVSSGSALSQWLCRIHNEVNVMLGKPEFDCSRVLERWKDGPADGSCG